MVFVFLAFYLRRFGPRYVAVGMLALIPVFLSSFVGYGVEQLPRILVSAAVGILCAYAFRFFVLPDRPEGVLRHSVAAFGIQLGLTLDAVADTMEDRRSDEERRERLRREDDRLNERAGAVEGRLSAEDVPVSRERSEKLRLYLFDAEMAASYALGGRLALRRPQGVPPEVRRSLLRALREFRATLAKQRGPPRRFRGGLAVAGRLETRPGTLGGRGRDRLVVAGAPVLRPDEAALVVGLREPRGLRGGYNGGGSGGIATRCPRNRSNPSPLHRPRPAGHASRPRGRQHR